MENFVLDKLVHALADYITRPVKERKRGDLAGEQIAVASLLRDFLKRCEQGAIDAARLNVRVVTPAELEGDQRAAERIVKRALAELGLWVAKQEGGITVESDYAQALRDVGKEIDRRLKA